MPQAIAHQVDRPGDEGQWHQGDQRQLRIDRHEDRGRHQNHQHIVGEIEQVQREKHTDPVAFIADSCNQVTGSFGPKVFKR